MLLSNAVLYNLSFTDQFFNFTMLPKRKPFFKNFQVLVRLALSAGFLKTNSHQYKRCFQYNMLTFRAIVPLVYMESYLVNKFPSNSSIRNKKYILSPSRNHMLQVLWCLWYKKYCHLFPQDNFEGFPVLVKSGKQPGWLVEFMLLFSWHSLLLGPTGTSGELAVCKFLSWFA